MTLLLLGLAALGPAHADPCQASTEAPLQVATLNAWGLPSPVAADRRGRLPRISRWLEGGAYDLVGLQELWRGALRLFPLARSAFTAGPVHGDSGLVLATRHPVHHVRTHTYKAERGLDALKAKGVLLAELSIDAGRDVLVGVTHFQAGGGKRNAAVRARQVEELLGELDDPQQATILLGDFNLYDREPGDAATWERLERAGFVDAAARTGAVGGTYPGLADRFDRIYVRNGARRCLVPRKARVVDRGLSDHRAVEATLGVRRR